MRPASRGAALVFGTVLAATTLIGCTTSNADPAFESEDVVTAPACADDRTCVEVRAPVVGSREGDGSCVLYGPGSPDELEPLAESGALAMRPGEVTIWRVDLDGRLQVADLNPVCRPMIEG